MKGLTGLHCSLVKVMLCFTKDEVLSRQQQSDDFCSFVFQKVSFVDCTYQPNLKNSIYIKF